MRKIIISISVVLSGMLTSCGVYKTYSRPETETEPIFGDVEIDDTVSFATMSWKQVFTDRNLQDLIAEGLERNTDLRIARLKTQEAEAVLSNARLSYLPGLSIGADGGVKRYDGTVTQTYGIAASASWELDLFGKTTNAKRGAQEAVEGSRDYALAVQTGLIATIVNSYYTLSMLDRQLEIGRQTLQNWDKTIHTLEALKKAGKMNDAAVLQACADRLQLEASLLSIEQSISETENSLSALLARPAGRIKRGQLEQAEFPRQISVGVPLQLLSNRPDVRQAERSLAQAFYATNAARAAFYPSITLSGALGWSNNGGANILNPGSWLLNAVGSLVQPLFNRGANIANLKIAKARQEEALLTFQQSLLNAGTEVNDALTQWQTAQQRIELGRQQIETLQEAVRKTELLVRYSPANYLEVLTAQQALLSAQQALAQDCYSEIQGAVSLYHALGGGKW